MPAHSPVSVRAGRQTWCGCQRTLACGLCWHCSCEPAALRIRIPSREARSRLPPRPCPDRPLQTQCTNRLRSVIAARNARAGRSIPSRHSTEPGTELAGASHGRHAAADVAAVEAWNVPAPHLVHFPDPLVGLNVPPGQTAQAPPSGPVKPALHRQSVISSLPIS
eukprot:380372-Rhodomonas_salina.1